MSTHEMSEASELYCSGRRVACVQDIAAGTAASTERESAVQRLRLRASLGSMTFAGRIVAYTTTEPESSAVTLARFRRS
jgi:hypothetical protein